MLHCSSIIRVKDFMQGKIIKGIAGFYYVHIAGMGVYECKAKGVFRNKKIKPLVGDNVWIDIIDEEQNYGNITEVLPRKNMLIRPAVANVDQALVVFAVARPAPNFNLLDRFLVMMDKCDIHTIICFSKRDLLEQQMLDRLYDIYKHCGSEVHFISALNNEGVEDVIKPLLKDKTTVLAGPSGVGKSTLTNLLLQDAHMEVGTVSEKIGRGRHTTRHSEILHIEGGTYILDTPGFSSFYVSDIAYQDLRFYFGEFSEYEGKCHYDGCAHICEPGCAVKAAVEEGHISRTRYENYIEIYNDLKSKRKY